MSQQEGLSAGEGSIDSIHRDFNGEEFGWNGKSWLIELEQQIQLNVKGSPVMVDYFVVSHLSDRSEGVYRTVIFAVNDMYRPLMHQGVVGSSGWSMKRATNAFREWLELRPDVRASKEVVIDD